MNWQNIDGWFSEDDARCYELIAEATRYHGEIAEVGVWMGRSFCCLIEQLKKKKKLVVHVFGIDTFEGSDEEEQRAFVREYGNVRERTALNIELTRWPYWSLHQLESVVAARHFDEEFLDAVFIDGAHDAKSVTEDIRAWMPKVRDGGIIAGHDYNVGSVKQPVDQIFALHKVEVYGNCWLVRL